MAALETLEFEFRLLQPMRLSALVFGASIRITDAAGTLIVIAGLVLATWPAKSRRAGFIPPPRMREGEAAG